MSQTSTPEATAPAFDLTPPPTATAMSVTKRNGGKAQALNTGMSLARGEFIVNMDGDTKLSGNALYFQYSRLK